MSNSRRRHSMTEVRSYATSMLLMTALCQIMDLIFFFFLPFKFHPNLTFTTTPILHNKCEQQPQLSMHNKNDHYNYRFDWFFSKLPKMLLYFGQTERTKIETLQQKHHKDIRIFVKHLMQLRFSCGVTLVNAQFQWSAWRLEDSEKDATACTHACRGRIVRTIKVGRRSGARFQGHLRDKTEHNPPAAAEFSCARSTSVN